MSPDLPAEYNTEDYGESHLQQTVTHRRANNIFVPGLMQKQTNEHFNF